VAADVGRENGFVAKMEYSKCYMFALLGAVDLLRIVYCTVEFVQITSFLLAVSVFNRVIH
jgi:hypothetical protein